MLFFFRGDCTIIIYFLTAESFLFLGNSYETMGYIYAIATIQSVRSLLSTFLVIFNVITSSQLHWLRRRGNSMDKNDDSENERNLLWPILWYYRRISYSEWYETGWWYIGVIFHIRCRKFQEIMETWNWRECQLLVDDDVNLLSENKYKEKDARNVDGLEVNAEKITYHSCRENRGQNCSIEITDMSF
jgi:hypothetical protein